MTIESKLGFIMLILFLFIIIQSVVIIHKSCKLKRIKKDLIKKESSYNKHINKLNSKFESLETDFKQLTNKYNIISIERNNIVRKLVNQKEELKAIRKKNNKLKSSK